MSIIFLIAGYRFLLGAIAPIVSFFSAIKASRGASISWGRHISPGRGSSSLSQVAVSLSFPVVGGATSAEIHGYQDIVH